MEGPFGPRYLQFHPTLPIAYLVNEISSTVTVFSFLEAEARIVVLEPDAESFKNYPTLKLIQEIRTIPQGFPKKLNTCGRITVDPTGKFVLVSNRGHNSIAIFSISYGTDIGTLSSVGYYHTRGSTPRHFQFDPSGRCLIVANQDTDSISVFQFNNLSGQLIYTGNTYNVPSPNFVCCTSPFIHANL
eukprot:TRINITY_DN12592_c0_g1_i4.p1 TRINITY_DN12592_c0_g1~~TRINITY_DN12592_c0_g1_i4.p1  ORF type:complete len:187 (+),score=31.79 TRINITY_DN12592_c0_g1_i4:731-1291(+)